MVTSTATKKSPRFGTVSKVGMGAAAAAAAVASGYYFYAHKNAGRHRRVAVRWASDLKNDVVRRAKKLPRLDRSSIVSAVDGAVAAYETVRSIDRKDIERAGRELKNNWRTLISESAGKKKASLAAGHRRSSGRTRAKIKSKRH